MRPRSSCCHEVVSHSTAREIDEQQSRNRDTDCSFPSLPKHNLPQVSGHVDGDDRHPERPSPAPPPEPSNRRESQHRRQGTEWQRSPSAQAREPGMSTWIQRPQNIQKCSRHDESDCRIGRHGRAEDEEHSDGHEPTRTWRPGNGRFRLRSSVPPWWISTRHPLKMPSNAVAR